MNINCQSSNSFPTAPTYISQLVSFIISNLNNGDIFEYFCFVIKGCHLATNFASYRAKIVSPTSEETQLLDLLNNFYTSAGSDLDTQRGNLLEYIIDEILSNKYVTHSKHYEAVLELLDSHSVSIATISPNNVDFFLEESASNDKKCFECKISVERNYPQIVNFNTFAGVLRTNNVNCPIKVVHIVNDTYAKLYPRWYPNLQFVGLTELKSGNL